MNPKDNEPTAKNPADAPDPSSSATPPSSKPVPGEDTLLGGTPPAAAELIDDIEAYQKRIEHEWERAKNIYQSRISEIMDDFLKKGVGDAPVNGNGASSAPKSQADPAPEGMEGLVARVAAELRAMDARAPRGATPQRPMLPGPAPRRSFWKRAVLLAVGAAIIGAGAVRLQMPEWTPLPYARTGAIAVVSGRLYVADWFRKTLYVHAAKRGAPILSVEQLPVGLVTGLQPEANALWTLDGLSHEILRHASSVDHLVIDRFPAPDAKPVGLIRDGDDLWLAGLATNTLYRLRADDPTEVRDRFDLPLPNVTALQLQNRRLWVLDGKAREMSVYRLQKPLKALATFDLDPFLRGATPTGFALADDLAWIVTENPAAIVRVPLAKIKKSKSSDF